MSKQARNQEFFRARKFFWNKGHFDKQSSTTRKRKVPLGKIFGFFSWKLLQTYGSDNHKTLPILIVRFHIWVIYHWLIFLASPVANIVHLIFRKNKPSNQN